ncbi:M28 family peptidase [Bacteroidales bacterium OttesenSCG-928-C19]|nr:M28 family peptidase [Bacteroidales bacterium OttesenSCG-928-C19]
MKKYIKILKKYSWAVIVFGLLKKVAIIAVVLFVNSSCGGGEQKKANVTETKTDYTKIKKPLFDSDSAYAFVERQVAFGPRVPGTKAHAQCAEYLINSFSEWADTMYVQNFTAAIYNDTKLPGKNIIASFSPEKNIRILLGAHWDSRMFADQDPDEANYRKPILGANDGASGVGVLMEIARLLKNEKPNVGIDIILFDIEDQGTPEFETNNRKQDTWCLGAQYWTSNRHVPYYQAKYGILLDMVGYSKPQFTMEDVSMLFAPGIMNKVWDIAAELGYQSIFPKTKTGAILDDHYYVNRDANIPMIDIVQYSNEGSFFEHWHTVNDNMDVIDRKALEIVGNVVLTTIFAE